MDNLNEPHNIIGMADLLLEDNEDIDLEELENSIMKGVEIKKKSKETDYSEEFNKEIDRVTKEFDIENNFSNGFSSKKNDLDDDFNFKSNDFGNNDFGNKRNDFGNNDFSKNNDDDDEDDDIEINNKFEKQKNMNFHSSWSAKNPEDPYLLNMTNEEKKQKHINKVLSKIDDSNKYELNLIHQEEEEDEMARIFEQIDLLRSNLETEGIDLSRIPEINTNTSKKDAKAILKILQIKNDRLRYCDLFEEGILVFANGLEKAFDGKKEWFGHKPDLVGWSDTVKIKLRRLRVDTSSFVSNIMKGHNVNSGWRIIMELLPSIFLYSRERRVKSGDNLISDDSYKDALRTLQT
jgi:hypothetical protein